MRGTLSGPTRRLQIFSAQALRSSSAGIAVPLFLAIISVLVLGSLILADRSVQAFLGIAFQNQSWEAREAAELGMAHFVGELNKPRNRGLLVKRSVTATLDDTGIWGIKALDTQIALSTRFNTCLDQTATDSAGNLINTPDLSKIDPAGDRTYGRWYVNEDGSITSSNTGQKRSFALVGVTRTASDDKDIDSSTNNYLNLFTNRPNADGRRVILKVRGESIRNNKVMSSIILEKEFELTPKCCGVPFGGSQGNLNYDDQTAQLCAQNLGMGMVGGASSSTTGVISINGNSTSITNGSVAVSPIYCLNVSTSCGSVNGGTTKIQIISNNLPAVPTYTSPVPTLNVNLDFQSGASSTNKGSFSTCSSNSNDCSGDTSSFRYCTTLTGSSTGRCNASDSATVFNADASTFPLYCATAVSSTELHCQLSALSISNNSKMPIIFKVGTRALRLYFPDAGTVVDASAGSGGLVACTAISTSASTRNQCTTGGSSTNASRVALFGSRTLDQVVNLGAGGISSLNIFAYFPKGQATLSGSSGFTGILWSDDITSNGNTTWTIPGSGLASVMDLMGMDGPGGNNPPVFDYVLRGTDYSRWIGG